MKKFISMLATAFCIAVTVIMLNPLQARADGRYIRITYDGGTNAWYESFDNGATWYATGGSVSDLQEGDTVLVDAGGVTPATQVQIYTDKRLATIAVTGNTVLNINCPTPADLVYASNGATLIYTGNVKKVICNPACATQIIGNAGVVEVKYETGKIPVFAITGTVDEFHGIVTDGKIRTDLAYSFAAGTVHAYDDGIVYVAEGTLKGAPDATTTTAAAAGSGKKQLDQVPKTGSGVNTSFVFFGVSALLAIAAVTVKRKENVKQH